jgi:Tfp pilus assembly protein PilN
MTVQPQTALPPTRVEWAPVPRVNLLPPEILDARRFVGLQRRLAAGVGASVLLAGLGFGWAWLEVSHAQADLEATQATTRSLTAQQAKYADVPRVLAQVDAAKSAREQALGQDVRWFRFLGDLALVTPSTVSLSSLQITLDSAGGSTAAAGSSNPLAAKGIGLVTVSGTAARYPDVATWLEAIVKVHGLDSSTLQTATRDETGAAGGTSGAVQFTSKVQLTADALSHRYDRKAS